MALLKLPPQSAQAAASQTSLTPEAVTTTETPQAQANSPASQQTAGDMLRAMDTGRDQVVDVNEVKKVQQETWREVGKAIDTDGNGIVTKGEIKNALIASGLNADRSDVGGMENAIKNLGSILAQSGVQLSGSGDTRIASTGSGLNVHQQQRGAQFTQVS